MTDADPEVIAGYHLLRLVGTGGMGKVYAAQHPRLPRQDALKILSPTFSGDPVFRDRFEREGQLAASLEHPNIVPVYDCGNDGERLWLSMRLVNGPTAAQELAGNPGGLSPAQVIGICLPVARALDFAHSRKLQHRDVKPENILIDTSSDTPHVLLSDFGIARIMGDTARTGTGTFIGTIDYSSPEHLSGDATDGRSDQYSLACTAAHLLTGTKPFAATQISALMLKHISGPRPSITLIRPDLPSQVDDVFRRALAIDPAQRFASCTDFVAALDHAFREPPPTTAIPHRSGPPATTRNPLPPANSLGTTRVPLASAPARAPQPPPTALLPHRSPPPQPSGPHPAPPIRSTTSTAGRPDDHHSRRTGTLIGAITVVGLLIGGGVAYAMLSGSDDDEQPAAAVSESAAPVESSEPEPPPRQQYDILNVGRQALDPCKLPAALLQAGGMHNDLSPEPPRADALLCEGTFTGRAPSVLMGGYVAGTSTADWMMDQYSRGTPAFSDLPGWRRYEATDRVTRCKYGFVSDTSPRYTFEIAVVVRPATSEFSAQARAAACDRLANVARAIDPAMPQ